MFCHLLLRFLTSVGAVFCSLLGFPCLRVGALLACGVYGAGSWLVLLLRSVCPSPALAVGWFGHRSVAPPAALMGSLFRRSVTLGSCTPYPAGSSLENSYGFVVQAPGVFLGLFTEVISSHFQWLRIARGGSWFILILHPPLLGGGRCCHGVLSGACRLALVGLRCLWVPRS